MYPESKTKRLQFAKQDRDLREANAMYLTIPVRKVVYTNTVSSKALSTTISDDSEVEPVEVSSYAAYKDDLKDIAVSGIGWFKIKIWRYSSMNLARLEKYVGKLPRYLSTRDKEDMDDEIEMIPVEL